MEKKVFINIEDSHSGHDDSYSSQTSTQGVLRLLGHVVCLCKNIYFSVGLVGTDANVGAHRSDQIHAEAPGLVAPIHK